MKGLVAVSTRTKPLLLLEPSLLVFLGKLPVSSAKSRSRKILSDSPAGCGGSVETVREEEDPKAAAYDTPVKMRDASPVVRGRR